MPEPAEAAEVASSFCAWRGGKQLSQPELQAHLASLVRLDNVAVFLGAGASAGPVGGKTMPGLWKDFEATSSASHDFLVESGFFAKGDSPDVERLANDIEIAVREWERKRAKRRKRLRAARDDLRRAVVRACTLNEAWWSETVSDMDLPTALGPHRMVLQKVCAARQPGQPVPWFFTPNYDLAVEWSAESLGLKVTNGFSGLHARRFSPHDFDLGYRNTIARGEARFGTYSISLVKLHGSLSWVIVNEGEVVERPASQLWPSIKAFADGEDGDFPNLMILPSAAKYLETVGYPLGEMLRRFSESMAQPQTALLTCGYSFSDDHLNRIFLSAFQNPTLQAVLFIPFVKADEEGKGTVGKTRRFVHRLLEVASPQVTIVGGGKEAYMDKFANLLPDPAIFDEPAAKVRRTLHDLDRFIRGDARDGGQD